MIVKYLNTTIENKTGSCYEWIARLGKNTVTGSLAEVKRQVMAFACKKRGSVKC